MKWNLLLRSKSFWILIYLGVMPSVFGSALGAYCLSYSNEIRSFGTAVLMGVNLLFAFILALGLMPTTFYSLLSGYLLGWSCIPYLVWSYIIASILGYLLCVKLDDGKLLKLLNEKYPMEQFLQKLSNTSITMAFFCRLSPTLPFAILNALFAMAKFPFFQYLIGSILGMLPRTLFAIYIGQSFTNIHSVDDLKSDTSLWFALATAIISFVGIGWVVKKKLF